MTVDSPSTVAVGQSFSASEGLAQMGRVQKKGSKLQGQQPQLQKQSRQPVQLYQTGESEPSRAAPWDSGSAPISQRRPQVFPWSTRRLTFPPPHTLHGPSQNLVPSPSPFPRYGFAIPPITTSNNEIYLFGGLSRDTMVSDMYLIASRDLTATLIETAGDIPSPRVGHASELANNVLIVWGGATKQDGQANSVEEPHDNSLYLFNTATRQWTQVVTAGDSPVGRYGHATAMIGTKFFIFGGQSDGCFRNDLWAFDFNTVTTPVWEKYHPSDSISPPPRANHICVAYNEKIYMFGGTDGLFHYNDTWEFDVVRRTWKELSCIGYIPTPREAHAATIVEDVMYVFGGRNTNGKDLNDLAAFNLTRLDVKFF
ncbi:hypothetical protein Clacol_004074 [Clathrus columnatus]|uniref:Galactose oxidase n=1 Tax=Clathrus columnatus TaxID=1419009 RepID=A0AAV5AD57_9AGAM|nr:hypothetical protein Clacol_004074 [Clathrus columnatus]